MLIVGPCRARDCAGLSAAQPESIPADIRAAAVSIGDADFRAHANCDLSLDIANDADAVENALERFVTDSETCFLTLSLRRGISERLQLDVDLPLVTNAEGVINHAIESWHDASGMSNTKPRGPGNQLEFSYSGPRTTGYQLSSPGAGVGDIQLTRAIALKIANASDGVSVAVRSGIKLPTGSAAELRGSGAADFSPGIYVSGRRLPWTTVSPAGGMASQPQQGRKQKA